jgi:hypothetical protein
LERRKFIFNTTLSLFGLMVTSKLVSCSSKDNLQLDDIISKPEQNLLNTNFLKKEGNSDFGYYTFQKSNFEHKTINGQQAVVYYKNSKIIGYTIQINGNELIKNYLDTISKLYGNYTINFENDFGKEYQWNTPEKIIKLSFNDYKNLPKLTFYSEILKIKGDTVI